MILHTGLRTDIPAFYSKWFLNRLRDEKVLVRNPYNEKSVISYKLTPDVIDVLCFCTKNPAPLLTDEAVNLLSRFNQFWFVTITPYGKTYEPNVPEKSDVINSFKKLSQIIGKENVSWRYDPVFIYEKYTVEQHKISFEKICKELSGFTEECIFSFIDLYPKVKRNFPDVKEVTKEQQLELADFFVQTGKKYGIKAKSCCENPELKNVGVDISGCMTTETYERTCKSKLNFPNRHGSRKECSCFLACDIGAYNTCAHFCRYCYANYSKEKVIENMKNHNPDSPLLIGNLNPDDKITIAKQESWKSQQGELF